MMSAITLSFLLLLSLPLLSHDGLVGREEITQETENTKYFISLNPQAIILFPLLILIESHFMIVHGLNHFLLI